jgi:hypothetical protein
MNNKTKAAALITMMEVLGSGLPGPEITRGNSNQVVTGGVRKESKPTKRKNKIASKSRKANRGKK